MGADASTEFSSHPAGIHHRVLSWHPWGKQVGQYGPNPHDAPASWEGDALSGLAYMEGPGLYKHGGYWFICASYGGMDWSYTIRCCRQDAKRPPTGPFLDKKGRDCAKFDSSAQVFGQSMLLGDDGDQLVPGHPAFWAEADGQVYMGYDYRPYPQRVAQWNEMKDEERLTTNDVIGARKVYWHNGWPTI